MKTLSRLVGILPAAALLALPLLGSGCVPTCTQTCNKLTSCEENSDWSGEYAELCAENCERQYNLYEIWGDTTLQDGLDDSKVCIRESTCEEITEGECYDEDLYAF